MVVPIIVYSIPCLLTNSSLFAGEVGLWFDGECVISATDLILRESSESIVKGMHFETFFGGMFLPCPTNNANLDSVDFVSFNKDTLLTGHHLRIKEHGLQT